jgi:hypothetical protein
MYSDADLDAAVKAGAMTPEEVAKFRGYMAESTTSPIVDEEHFRLITGFNDIFVSIASILILIAVGRLGDETSPGLGSCLAAAASWGLAEFFTRRRRMALPSILFLFGFTGGVFFASVSLMGVFHPPFNPGTIALPLAGSAAAAAVAAFLHWRRFMVPITPAVGMVAVTATLLGLMLYWVPMLRDHVPPLVLVGGVACFALAMHWDMSDRERKTRRSDVAFWLHLAAAPMIVHPVFTMLGLSGFRLWAQRAGMAEVDLGNAVSAIVIYIVLAGVALAIDRRALLVSALAYVLVAASTLIGAAGSLTYSFALTALVIGSALLMLSAFWHPTRNLVLSLVPQPLRSRLPATA